MFYCISYQEELEHQSRSRSPSSMQIVQIWMKKWRKQQRKRRWQG